MKRLVGFAGLSVVLCGALFEVAVGAEPAAPADKAVARAPHVYGEWCIWLRPDKMKEYTQLIETKGLPLFCAAGGRMVGWWTTLVGDFYEQVTIWEFDDMAAFEQAIEKLGKDKGFAEFVALAIRCSRASRAAYCNWPISQSIPSCPSRPGSSSTRFIGCRWAARRPI